MPSVQAGHGDEESISGKERLVLTGPTILVQVGFDPGFTPNAHHPPSLLPQRIPALIDTGANQSAIDADFATSLGLPLAESGVVSGIQGPEEVRYFSSQIYVPDLDVLLFGQFAGARLLAGGQPHVVLLGRTFLQNFTMTYEGRTGIVTLYND